MEKEDLHQDIEEVILCSATASPICFVLDEYKLLSLLVALYIIRGLSTYMYAFPYSLLHNLTPYHWSVALISRVDDFAIKYVSARFTQG